MKEFEDRDFEIDNTINNETETHDRIDVENDVLVKIYDEKYPLGEVSNIRWILAMVLLNMSFILTDLFKNSPSILILFFVGPIASLFILGNKAIRKLFKLPKFRDIPAVIGMTILLILLAAFVGVMLQNFDSVENPIVDVITEDNFSSVAKLLMIQLVIEEIFFIIWFLFLYHKVILGGSGLRTVIAWIGSSLAFGAMHLSTYNYNIIQALIGIGIIRMGMSIIYIRRKNLTLAYLVHVLYDLLILSATLAV